MPGLLESRNHRKSNFVLNDDGNFVGAIDAEQDVSGCVRVLFGGFDWVVANMLVLEWYRHTQRVGESSPMSTM